MFLMSNNNLDCSVLFLVTLNHIDNNHVIEIIKSRCRFIIQDDLTPLIDKNTCQTESLILTTRNLTGQFFEMLFKSQFLENLFSFLNVLCCRLNLMTFVDHQCIFQYIEPREARIMLMHHMNFRRIRCHLFSIQNDVTSVTVFQAGNNPHQRTLTNTGRSRKAVNTRFKVVIKM